VSLLEVDPADVADSARAVSDGEAPLVDAHGLEPAAILSMLGSLGGTVARVVVVACEPASVEEGIGLTEPVQAAVPRAIEMVRELMWSGLVPAEEVSR